MRKNISLTLDTIKRLDALYQAKGDSYEKIICRLLDEHGIKVSTVPTLTDPRD